MRESAEICVFFITSIVCYKRVSLYKKQLKTPIHLGAKGENICSFTPSISLYSRISLKNYRFSINFSRKTPKLKYEYQYDANGNLAEKKAYRWNADNRSWQPAYLLNYLPGDGIYLIDYAEYDKASGAFTQNIQTSIYYQQTENGMLLTDIQR